MQLVSVDSETMRPAHTASINPSRLTTRSRLAMTYANKSNTFGSTATALVPHSSSRRSVSKVKFSNKYRKPQTSVRGQTKLAHSRARNNPHSPNVKATPSQGAAKVVGLALWHAVPTREGAAPQTSRSQDCPSFLRSACSYLRKVSASTRARPTEE